MVTRTRNGRALRAPLVLLALLVILTAALLVLAGGDRTAVVRAAPCVPTTVNVPGDGVDGDCDGAIDEEAFDGTDNDGDCVGTPPPAPPGPCSISGGVDEDLAAFNELIYIPHPALVQCTSSPPVPPLAPTVGAGCTTPSTEPYGPPFVGSQASAFAPFPGGGKTLVVSDMVHHEATVTANTAGGHGLTITFGDLSFITCQRTIIAVDGDGNGIVDSYVEAAQSVTGLSLTPPPYVPVAQSPFVPVALGTMKTVHLTVHQIAPGEYAVTCDIDGVVVTGTAIVPSQTVLLGAIYSINLAVFDAAASSPLPFAEAPASGIFSGFSLRVPRRPSAA